MEIGKRLKGLFVEEVPEANEKPARESASVNGEVLRVAIPLTAPGDGEMYTKILGKTGFESTEAGAIISKYLSSMEGIPMDANMKLKMAATQAQKLDHLTPDAILAAFDEMKTLLTHEREVFAQGANSIKEQQIDAREAQIQQSTQDLIAAQKRVSELQQTLATLQTELAQAQSNLANVQAQFTAAATRREGEITQERDRVASILKG